MRRLVPILLLVLLAAPALAQGRLLSPAEFLGYELGERFTPHHRIVAYVEHVAAHSDRVTMEVYGTSVQGQPLVVAYVSDPANLTRLEAIRQQNLRAAGVLPGGGDPERALVWFSYNVHGNESVGSEAALETLYRLADPANAEAARWLRDVVLIFDPNLNPDGRDRYVHFFTQTVGRRADPTPAAREHREPWPGSRVNHYYFDLNRDWAWGTQQETRYRLALYNRWLPHVHVDFHEQAVDDPYYFPPAAEPFHERVTDWQRELQAIIGRDLARAFDADGRLYFTRQRFDLLYPGYGDTWPTFNGAIGMTYEQGGSGRAGLAIVTAEGDTLTLAMRIRNHVEAGLTTLATVAREERAVREGFRRFFAEGVPGPTRAYVLRGDAGRLDLLAQHLDLQGIRYGWADRGVETRGVAFGGGRARPAPEGRVRIEAGDLVVPKDQPKAVLVSVLFEPETALADSLTYDVTAWSLPYAYGLEAFAVTTPVPMRATPERPSPPDAHALEAPYAYLAPWESPADVPLLARLLREGVGVRIATEPFALDGRRYGRGTLVVTRAGNARLGDRFDAIVREAAEATGRPVRPVASGAVDAGPDFGSADKRFLRAPRVALLAGEPAAATGVGTAWHFFDEVLEYPASLLWPADLDAATLREFDVLVMPHGSWGGWLTDARAELLLDWIRAGGRLVAIQGAVRALADREAFGLRVRTAERDTTTEALLRRYADRERDAIAESLAGSIFRVQVDDSHPLAFGLPEHYYALRQGATAYDLLTEGWNVGAFREGTPTAGFAGARTRDRLADALAFGVRSLGRGQVVYFVDDPLFRGFWVNGRLLFANAVFGLGAR